MWGIAFTLPELLQNINALVNLNNWGYYYFKINQIAAKKRNFNKNYYCKEKTMNVLTILVIIGQIDICIYYIF